MRETDVRQLLVDALEADLVGPFVPDAHSQGGQEVLPIAPSRWYLTGFLAPQEGRVPDVEDRDSTDDGLAAGSESQAEDAGTEEPEGLLPPELIVQDELHLISGPLGTMVGLYEAAVDYLCERPFGGKAWPPKVICSTATVRRAREQIQALFGRPMNLFPPRGVTDGDNFFSRVLEDQPGRLYVGVGAPGRALRAVSVRSYATLLAAARKYFDPKGDHRLPTGEYLRVLLDGARTQETRDEVQHGDRVSPFLLHDPFFIDQLFFETMLIAATGMWSIARWLQRLVLKTSPTDGVDPAIERIIEIGRARAKHKYPGTIPE